MALLNKLFSPVPNSSAPARSTENNTLTSNVPRANCASPPLAATTNKRQNINNQSVHSKQYLSQFPFDGQQVRVLLYMECDTRGRRLLFDSSALQRVSLKDANRPASKREKVTRVEDRSASNYNHSKDETFVNKHTKSSHSSDFIDVCEEYGYKHNRPNSADITSIGEMVFGALAMSFRGTALKVHWLQKPSRILFSQVFLTPMINSGNSQSPYSTISMNSLATPRTSISSEQGSIDGFSMNSYSMPYSISVGRHMSLTPSDRTSLMTFPLDVPDQQSLSTNSENFPRYSSTYSTATDSGYSGLSRSQFSNDYWTSSCQYSTRSSLGSVTSEQLDPQRKHSMDSSIFSTSPIFDEIANDGSLQRRVFRNLRTSFENENSVNDFIGFISDSYSIAVNTVNGGGSEGGSMGMPNYRRASYGANESRSNPEIGKRRDLNASMTVKPMVRRAKLGLAVCITMSDSFEEEMELFCSEHIALLETMLGRLRACTERAYVSRRDLLQMMYQAWQETQQWLSDLFTAPRIKCPAWLSITTSGSKYSKNVAEQFIKELSWLISLADTKDKNFFISTMLTAILTHHLGWVSTMSAFNSSSSRCKNSLAAIEQRAKLLQVSQKHPYNALWAQMGDLYGANGIPPKLTRTIIYGTDKLSVGRLLNILTYFIRCTEVRRSAKREDFDKELIDSIVCKNNNEALKKKVTSRKKMPFGGGLTRIPSCKQNLNATLESYEVSGSSCEDLDVVEFLPTLKKNEIPNVLAFRDSRFVQQELRIGNYLMDTGINKSYLHLPSKNNKDEGIRLTITTPDNMEIHLSPDETIGCSTEAAIEAVEIDTSNYNVFDKISTESSPLIAAIGKRNFFSKMVPQTIKEGLTLTDLEKVQNRTTGILFDDRINNLDGKKEECGNGGSHLSLSDLITQNSMGKSDRMMWGVERFKEIVTLEEHIHFDNCQKQIEREHDICLSNTTSENGNENEVVFLLGDNKLVNIKKSMENISSDSHNEQAQDNKLNECQTFCALHQRTHGPNHSKKHSGVKFDFKQYPLIASKYMKSKNLVMSNYNLLMDKSSKLEAHESNVEAEFPTTNNEDPIVSSHITPTNSSSECMVCNSILNSYQTPSNATELEFETDDVHCYSIPSMTSNVSSSNERVLQTVSSAASVATLKSLSNATEEITTPVTSHIISSGEPLEQKSVPPKKTTYNGNNKTFTSNRSSISSVAAKCASINEAVHLLKLPVPGIKELPQEEEQPGDMKVRAGFIPSLLLTVNDHYISDMVLQGICTPPSNWEMKLREDLTLAAHSASLISMPVENIAIVADMEKWDVRLISSQAQYFPYAGGQSAPVGMSQLVSNMLETVFAMHSSGLTAYECLSFLECKMQEIYLQSETLAAFLLETDFCALSSVTSVLNLSENDVPLLLSIASVHTPQISKKYGISFK